MTPSSLRFKFCIWPGKFPAGELDDENEIRGIGAGDTDLDRDVDEALEYEFRDDFDLERPLTVLIWVLADGAA